MGVQATAEGTDVIEPSELYHLDDLFSDVERTLKDRVRQFCDKEIVPVANERWQVAESMTQSRPVPVQVHRAAAAADAKLLRRSAK